GKAPVKVMGAVVVGHRDAFVLTLDVEPLPQRAPRPVPEVQPRIRDRDIVEPDARYPSLLSVIPALRVVRFDEEPTGERIRVVGGPQVLRDVTVLGYSFWRENRTHLFQKRKRTLA